MSRTELLKKAPEALRAASLKLKDHAGTTEERSENQALASLLEELAEVLSKPEYLTTPQVAELLGVSSPNTIKNWLKGGSFPGAYKTQGGHWRFPLKEVLAVQARVRASQQRNTTPAVQLPDYGDEEIDDLFQR